MSGPQRDLRELLREPGPAFRPAMFWLLNGTLTAERMRDQIRQMHERGCGGFFLHPMGESFRTGDFLQGIDPPYLSDGYFEMIRVAVEEADRLGMYAWLYDEGGWPSGHAQGMVTEGRPELRGRVLRIDGDGETIAEITLSDRRALRFTEQIGGYPVDTLRREATERFIELTHERYAEVVGEFFGGTIPGMFTDEVGVGGEVGGSAIPWTPGLLEIMQERRGIDLKPYLPALFSEDALGFDPREEFSAEEIAAARCEFSELWTDLFEENYFRPVNEWCAEHGLIHTGHVGGEDTLPGHRRSFGHFFKTAGALHAPGVDAIWRQIFPGEANFCFPQFASSALAHRDAPIPGASGWRRLVLSESFAVYGYSLTPEQMRWVADYQFVRGVNYIAPMALYYETSGGRFVGTMSHLGEGNPLWDSFSTFADHCATVSAAVRSSEPIADVAVYYPIEAAWVGGDVMQKAWESLQQVCGALERHHVQFDFIDARTLASAEIAEGLLETPGQLYGTVIVPETAVMPTSALERLADLREAGGRVVFVNEAPRMPAEFNRRDRFDAGIERLCADSVMMDADRARNQMGGDDARGFGASFTFMLDGFTAAYLGPRQVSAFTEREVEPGACLVAPEDEIERLAEMLVLTVGRYELQHDAAQPELRIASRRAGDLNVHLLHNEGDEAIEPTMMLVNESPRIVERWDTLAGRPRALVVHDEVSDATNFPLRIEPGESVLLVTRPPGPEVPAPERRPVLKHVGSEVRAQSIEVLREFVITTDGDLEIRENIYTPDRLPADFHLWPLEQIGLDEFSGTVRYVVDLYVQPGELDGRLFIDLGEVGCVARAWLNGEELGESAWPPHLVEITEIAELGSNELVVEVTTTLANQAIRPEILKAAEERGWMNMYYERTLPWMREDRRSGLIGPVRILTD